MLARGGRVFGVWLSRRSIYAERSALRLFLIQQRAWKPLCTSSRGSSIPEDKEYKVIEDEEIKEDSEENFQSSGEEKTRGEAGEDDAIAKVAKWIKPPQLSAHTRPPGLGITELFFKCSPLYSSEYLAARILCANIMRANPLCA
eukprot:1343750-Amorphochlora_amoeboformis.AAC.2